MAEKSDTWMPFYVGDYLSATSRLTTEQHGAYVLILLDYWKNGPPPDDDIVLAQIARLALPAWRKARPALIGFFEAKGGQLIQKRVEKERGRAAEITDERSKAGKLGAEKRWHSHKQTNGKPIANAMANPLANAKQNDAPSPSPEESKKESLTLENVREPQREVPPPGITDAGSAFEYVVRAARWRPANDRQRLSAFRTVEQWLASGYSLELVLAGIEQAIARRPGTRTNSLNRFTATIAGMHADGGAKLNGSGERQDVKALVHGVAANLSAGGG